MKKDRAIMSLLIFVSIFVIIFTLSKMCKNPEIRSIDKKGQKILEKDSTFTANIKNKKIKIDSIIKEKSEKDLSLMKKGELLKRKVVDRKLPPIDSIAKGEDSAAIRGYGELVKDQDSLIKNKDQRIEIKDTIIKNLNTKNELSDSLIAEKDRIIKEVVKENDKNLKRYNWAVRVITVTTITSLTLLLIIIL